MDEERSVVEGETEHPTSSDVHQAQDGEARLRPAFLWGTDAQIRRLG